MKFLERLLTLLLVLNLEFSQKAIAQQKASKKVCLTEQEFAETIKTLEDLLAANEKLLEIAKKYQDILASNPEIKIDPLIIVLDERSRTFLQEKVPGALSIGELKYDLDLRIEGMVVKKESPSFGFDLKFKAVYLYSFENNKEDKLEGYHSGGLALEPFYYKDFNLNLVLGSRFIAPALGYDITEHFGILVGAGINWQKAGAIFVGTSFDF